MVVGREETTTIWIRREAGKSEPPASSSSFLAPLSSPPPHFSTQLCQAGPLNVPPFLSLLFSPPLLARFQFHGSSIQIGGFRRSGRGRAPFYCLRRRRRRGRPSVSLPPPPFSSWLFPLLPSCLQAKRMEKGEKELGGRDSAKREDGGLTESLQSSSSSSSRDFFGGCLPPSSLLPLPPVR